ncbi:MAG: hypothetical protein ACLU4J_24350 [Butyricimonas paravirosa]
MGKSEDLPIIICLTFKGKMNVNADSLIIVDRIRQVFFWLKELMFVKSCFIFWSFSGSVQLLYRVINRGCLILTGSWGWKYRGARVERGVD